VEAELEEEILKYKMAVKDNLQLEWCWQAEPGKGGMECTILAHIWTGCSALSVQNKRHLHWKEIETISTMNNDTRGAVVAHNLLLEKDLSNTDHLAYKHRMASIMASPQAARKKRYIKLELGSVETNLPAGANPFQYSRTECGTTQHNSEPDKGDEGDVGTESFPTSSPTLPTPPTSGLEGGTTQHNSGPNQGHHMGSIGRQAALARRSYV
jgi:hypothetical protein